MDPIPIAPAPTKAKPKGGNINNNNQNKSNDNDTSTKPKRKPAKVKHLSRKQANALVIDSGIAIQEALAQLEQVRALAAKAGLSVDCTTLPRSTLPDNSTNNNTTTTPAMESFSSSAVPMPMPMMDAESSTADAATAANILPAAPAMAMTGGHSNTNHAIVRTGIEQIDRVAELRRNFWRRHRLMQPEMRQDGRWDKPRLPGERRRRIVRERDLPEAPPEPPMSGYIAFLGQMTVKLRHDRPDAPHDQSKVMQEVSKLWRIGLSEEERNYYNQFANDARDEYNRQMIEYRATGYFQPHKEFDKLPEANVWVRQPSKRNGLEEEICQYETVIFPKRPPSMNEAYRERERRSLFRRKLRLRGMENADGTLKDGMDFEELYREHQEKAAQENTADRDNDGTGDNKDRSSTGSSGEEE